MRFKRYFGWTHQADGSSVATAWFSIAYLPVIPLSRHRLFVRTSPTETSNVQTSAIPLVAVRLQIETSDDFVLFERLPINWRSVLLTYFCAYLLMPAVVVLPGYLLYAFFDPDADMGMMGIQIGLICIYAIAFIPAWLSYLIRRIRGIGAFKYRKLNSNDVT